MKHACLAALLICVAPSVIAAQTGTVEPRPTAYSGVARETNQNEMFNALRWRGIGP